MFQDFLYQEWVIVSNTWVEYRDGKSISVSEVKGTIKCRISWLSYRDFQFLDKIKDVSIGIAKLYTLPEVELYKEDFIIINDRKYQLYSKYPVSWRNSTHHNQFYIKIIE